MNFARSAMALILCLGCMSVSYAVEPAKQAPNTDPVYQKLRTIGLSGEAVAVNNLQLKRDIGIFTFNGTLYFLAPVEGKVTGAVFLGSGSFTLTPPTVGEKRSVAILTKEGAINESFESAVLRFTDRTYEELKQIGSAAQADTGRAADAIEDNLDLLRRDRYARYNLSARILQDVLSTGPGGLFYAFIKGSRYDSREIFAVDPQGVLMWDVQPEEVVFATYAADKQGVWYSGHLESEYAARTASGTQVNAPIDITHQKLETQLHRSGELRGIATTTFSAVRPGLKVASFNLFRNFEIDSVTDESGRPLPFIWEDVSFNENESDDPGNLSVILPKPLAAGETFTLNVVYGGKEAVTNEGSGNYYPVARDDWFPSGRRGDYAEYDMTFRIPKGMKIAATGNRIREANEGDQYVTEWKSEGPIKVSGFNFGRFKLEEQKLKNGFLVQSFANDSQPDWVRGLQHAVEEGPGSHTTSDGYALGSMETTSLMKKPLAEAQLAMGIYTDYFGPIPYTRIAMTQQAACNFGQAWPSLIWLPICAFFDSTVRHQLGVDDTRQPYWNVVAAHEIAHQWWGHTVGYASYRDQWISEGFSELSASIFLQAVYAKDPKQYQRFWRLTQEGLLQKNNFGWRPIDAGPVTMGIRVNNSKAGFGHYNTLIYGKGGFILHMLRMMMWDPKTGDEKFKLMMRDFVKTHYSKPASTEDFKAIVEKHITPDMNLDGNGKMDWFFNQFVYGTEVPKYEFTYNIVNDANGVSADLKLTQSGVSPNFKMSVPVYIEMANGATGRLGSFVMQGNTTTAQRVPLGKMPTPKRFLINHHYDVLTEN
ncbi:MAG TPA: M1 family aminopeptidase [Terriglobales bacterium]|nr:M1 family aminopeptidase [Terriglobales bacterium]